MNDLWRASKSRLVFDLVNAKTESECLALKPDNMKSDAEWKAFVKVKTSKEHQVRTTIFLLQLLIKNIKLNLKLKTSKLIFF